MCMIKTGISHRNASHPQKGDEKLWGYIAFLNLSEGHGRIISTACVLNALFSALSLWWVVQRTKLCLDFSCTTMLYHVLLCSVIGGRWPASATWWLIQLVCLGLACVGGEFLCMRTELAAIPVNLGGGRVDL